MFLISHRGNTTGRILALENSPDYVEKAIKDGFHVEIDVWLKNDSIFLGHDKTEYGITKNFLRNDKLWCHAKNMESLEMLLKLGVKNCFWHQRDSYTLTSSGYIWTFPGEIAGELSIVNHHNENKINIGAFGNKGIAGICSDWIGLYK